MKALLLAALLLAPEGEPPREAKPHSDAVRYIARALEEKQVVCLAEGGHASKTAHDFLRKLLRDARVQAALDVLIVEFATAAHQDVLDDFIYGRDVSHEQLSQVWRNTTPPPPTPWDSPLYYQLLREVREINASLPGDRKIRVLGGDPPIRWDEIESRKDHARHFRRRNSFPAGLAIEQAFSRNKTVLVIFGGAHLPRARNEMGGRVRYSITNYIEQDHPGSVATIGFLVPEDLNVEDRLDALRRGRIYETATHWSGELAAERMFPGVFFRDGSGRATLYQGKRVRDLFDALVYIGPRSEWVTTPVPQEVYADESYRAELNRRSMILFGRPILESPGSE